MRVEHGGFQRKRLLQDIVAAQAALKAELAHHDGLQLELLKDSRQALSEIDSHMGTLYREVKKVTEKQAWHLDELKKVAKYKYVMAQRLDRFHHNVRVVIVGGVPMSLAIGQAETRCLLEGEQAGRQRHGRDMAETWQRHDRDMAEDAKEMQEKCKINAN